MPERLPPEELESLIQGYLEGALNEEESRSLLAELRAEPRLAGMIVDEMVLDGMIAGTLAADGTPATSLLDSRLPATDYRPQAPSSKPSSFILHPSSPARRPFGSWSLYAAVAAAAAVLVASLLYAFDFLPRHGQEITVVTPKPPSGPSTDMEAELRRLAEKTAQEAGWNVQCFSCLGLIGEQDMVEEVAVLLEKAERELEWFRKDAAAAPEGEREDRERTCDYYAQLLAEAYGKAARLAIRHGQGETYGRRFQERQAELLRGVGPRKPVALDRLLMVAGLFVELEDYDAAFKAYETVLDKFDPDNDRRGLPDDQLVRFETLCDTAHIANTEAVKNAEDIAAVRGALKAIEPLVTGTPEVRDGQGGVKTAAVPPDYDRATLAIDEFLAKYPGYDMKDGGRKGEARVGLEQLRDELLLRLQLLRAANGMTTCLVNIGAKRKAEAKREADPAVKARLQDEARKAYSQALDCARDVARYWPWDAEITFELGECLLESADGDKARLEEARTFFDGLRKGLPKRGEVFWMATRRAFRARLALARYDEARVILVSELLTDPEGVKQNWPDFQADIDELARLMGKKPEEIVPAGAKTEPAGVIS